VLTVAAGGTDVVDDDLKVRLNRDGLLGTAGESGGELEVWVERCVENRSVGRIAEFLIMDAPLWVSQRNAFDVLVDVLPFVIDWGVLVDICVDEGRLYRSC
jgi:hypothetical protein